MTRIDRRYLWALNALGLRLRGVRMGFPCYIGPTLFLYNRRQIRLGKRVRIWPGLRLEVHKGATVTIEDGVALGPFCHITAAEDMTIGADSAFGGWNTISNVVHTLEEPERHPFDRPWEIKSVTLGKRLYVGQGAKILPGSSLGDQCAVGANAVVSGLEAPANAIITGIPARVQRIAEP